MEILIARRTTTTPGPKVTFDCPVCKTAGVSGQTASVVETGSFFYVIPFFVSRWVTLECASCNKCFKSPSTPEEMAAMPREELSQMIARQDATHIELIVKFLVIISVVFCIIPYFSLIIGLIAVACTFKRRSGWRIAAFVGTALSLLSTFFFTFVVPRL